MIRYIIRILVLPPVAIILCVALLKDLIKMLWQHLKYGSEFIFYRENRATIGDVYDFVRKRMMDKDEEKHVSDEKNTIEKESHGQNKGA